MTPASYLDAHAGDLTALLRRLVRLPTVNPPGDHYAAITALLTRELRAAGLRAQRLPIPAALLRRTLPPALHGHPRFNVLGKLAGAGCGQDRSSTPTTMWFPCPAAAGGMATL